jgi:hypothetical protein
MLQVNFEQGVDSRRPGRSEKQRAHQRLCRAGISKPSRRHAAYGDEVATRMADDAIKSGHKRWT